MDFSSLLREFQHMHLSGSEHVSVLVSRNKVLQSAKDSVSNSNFPWTKIPLVTFVGEEALDCGGPRREFFRYYSITRSKRIVLKHEACISSQFCLTSVVSSLPLPQNPDDGGAELTGHL